MDDCFSNMLLFLFWLFLGEGTGLRLEDVSSLSFVRIKARARILSESPSEYTVTPKPLFETSMFDFDWFCSKFLSI